MSPMTKGSNNSSIFVRLGEKPRARRKPRAKTHPVPSQAWVPSSIVLGYPSFQRKNPINSTEPNIGGEKIRVSHTKHSGLQEREDMLEGERRKNFARDFQVRLGSLFAFSALGLA